MKTIGSMLLPLVLLFLSTITKAGQGDVGQAPFSLFSSQSETREACAGALAFFADLASVHRYREVRVNDLFCREGSVIPGDRISIDLFGDDTLVATVSRVSSFQPGTTTITALADGQEGYLVLATTGGRSLGNLFLPGDHLFYKVISDPLEKTHYLVEMDARDRDILEGCPPEIPGATGQKEHPVPESTNGGPEEEGPGPGDVAHVEVMVAYTPAAKTWANQHGGGIQNVVAASMANTQLVFDNSQVLVEFSLAYSGKTEYEESGFSRIDLWRLVSSPFYAPFGHSVGGGFALTGYLEDVHELRNTHYADLVVLLTHTHDTGGVAFTLNCVQGKPKYGFSVVRVQQAASSYTKAHEIGHNFGCHHARDQLSKPGPTNWTNWAENTWSAGWRWQGDNGSHYCSVMAYEGGSHYADGITHLRVPLFSSPAATHQGAPAGHPEDADNVRTINKTKHVVASYRTPGKALLSTHPASDIELFQAVSGGRIDFVCESQSIMERGVVWDTIPFPTLEKHIGKTMDGPGETSFLSHITGLDPDTDYYVSAYATTEKGTAYGRHRFFYTPVAKLPHVSTASEVEIAHNRATARGSVTDGGNSKVYQRGIVWGTKPNPTPSSSAGITKEGTGEGSFVSTLGGLAPGNTYFYRAYAKNTAGINYGNQYAFNTPFATVSPNPFSHKIEVAFASEGREHVVIVLSDAAGQSVKRIPVAADGDTHITLNTTHLSEGVYLLRIESEQPFPVWRLIKAEL